MYQVQILINTGAWITLHEYAVGEFKEACDKAKELHDNQDYVTRVIHIQVLEQYE